MKSKITVYSLQAILILVLLYTLIFNHVLDSRIKVALFLLLYAFLIKIFVKKNRTLSINTKQVIKIMLFMGLAYVGVLYTLGIYTGFYKATITFSLKSLTKYIIPIALMICTSEYIRGKFLNYDTKPSTIMNFIIQVLIDLLIYTNIYKINSVDEIMVVIGYVVFASVSCNLLYNYTSKRYGLKPNIIYRLITVLYIYILPITPDIYIFFLSFYRMIYPFAIYYVLESFFGETEDSLTIKKQKLTKAFTSIIGVFLVIYICLVSCMFTIGALVIGSSSMKGTINKGDVIIFNKNIKAENIEKGQIIIFNKDKTKIVHRVIDKTYENGHYKFITKGDNNKKEDDGYITEKDLYGSVLFKIDAIGQPTIWLHDLFER